MKKQWHRRQAFMDNNDSPSSETVNPFLAALENPKTEPFSSCLKNLDKSASETFIKSNKDFPIQSFSSQSLSFFRPKPKGLVDGLSRFFTPTNKRKSRVAISSLGDSLTLEEEIQTSQAASNSFSGSQLSDQTTLNKKVGNTSFLTESKLKLRGDLSTIPSTSSSPSTKQSSFSSASSTTSTSSLNSHQTVKPSGSGQLKNLFDGLSHLYTASTDSRKRGSKNSVNSPSSPKRLCKKPNSTLVEKEFSSTLFCDRNSTGDVLSKDKEVFDVEEEEEDKHVYDSDASSSVMSSECSLSIKKQETFKIEASLSTFGHSDTLSYSQLFSSVPETRIFGSSVVKSKEDIAEVPFTENKSKQNYFKIIRKHAVSAIYF